MKITLIIVNYQSQKYLKRCLDSIELYLVPSLKKNGFLLDVVVINNDEAGIIPTANYSFFTTIVDSNRNIGFGAACNLGARNLTGDLLFFLNPDVQLIDSSLVDMFNFAISKKDIGIVGPKIIDCSRNAPQPWTAGKKTGLLKILFRNTFGAVWKRKTITQTDWVSGTALLIRRNLFLTLNGFDENFFMYFEDQDLCLRAQKMGYKTFFCPLSTIIHHNGKSWKNKQDQKREYHRSQLYFFEKHGADWEKKILNLTKKIMTKK